MNIFTPEGEGGILNQTSQLSLFHSETQGFWSILKVIPSNLTVKTVSLTQNVEANHPKLG